MAITSLSAGTGPAAAIIGGVALVLYGINAGWYLIFGGIGLSAIWRLRF